MKFLHGALQSIGIKNKFYARDVDMALQIMSFTSFPFAQIVTVSGWNPVILLTKINLF